jgi:iron complex transport system substrate-binding protein
MKTSYPERIICLTEETTEILYLLGSEEKIVGISGFTRRPPEARKTKPKVSSYITAEFDKILNLKPDFVFAFSDMQAEIVKELTLRGIQTVVFNQRSIKEILQNILVIGAIVGKHAQAEKLVASYESRIEKIKNNSLQKMHAPKVYFEEWYEPLISGICWVSELIEIAGGEDIFPDLRSSKSGKERIIKSEEVVERNPDIIIASWCGKKFKKENLVSREGWEKINAVKNNKIFEIDSTIILQPGPASLTEGLDELLRIIN